MTTSATPSEFPPLTPASRPDFSDVEISNSDDAPFVPRAPIHPVTVRPATDAELAEIDRFLETLSRGRSDGLCERYLSVLLGHAMWSRASVAP